MRWQLAHRAEAASRELADRHYSRQHIGATGFVPPGRCLVLRTPESTALWVTSWPFAEWVKHDWAGAWICSLFRNESPQTDLSSDLIREAVASTYWRWPQCPQLGMVTFVDRDKTKRKRDPGRCFVKAGFERVGETKGGLVALQLLPNDMPEPIEPMLAQTTLFA